MHARLLPLRAAVLLVSACASAPVSEPPQRAAPGSGTPLRTPRSEVEVAPYEGAHAADLREFAAEVLGAAPMSLAALRDETGLAFLPDRGPRVVLLDGTAVPPEGRVEVRVVDGRRRPEIRIRAASAASREFTVDADLPPLLVEAAVLAGAGERVPPGWMRAGLALHLGGTLDRRVVDALLTHPDVAPEALDVSALEPGFHAAALARIAVGERPFRRYIAARLGGADERTALREVGVERVEFLDAAAGTERDRRVRDLAADERVASLRAAHAAFLRGDVDGAEKLLGPSPGFAGGPVEAAAELLRAEIASLRGDEIAVDVLVDRALAVPGGGRRIRDARFAHFAVADVYGAPDAAWPLAAAFARHFPDDPRTSAAARCLGLDPGTLRDAVGADATTRAAAATALGESAHGLRGPAAEVLGPMMGDGQPSVRRAAAVALGVVRDVRAATALDGACVDADPSVRVAALEALALVDRSRALARTQTMAEDPVPEVREAVKRVRDLPAEEPPPPPSQEPVPAPAPPEAK